MESIVQFIQEQLNAIRPNAYNVSSERNLKSSLEKHEVVVSQLSGDVYSKSSNLPYQIDITTSDPDQVQGDFFVLARTCNNVPFTKIIQEGEENFQSVTYNIVFNTPVAMEKSVDIGASHYVRLVAFAVVNEMSGVNQVKKLEIDGETIEKLNSTYSYVTEPSSARVSGEELTKSKKKSSSSTIVFTSINNATVFLNKAFKISAGQLPGNTKFTVNFELYNGLKAELPMYVNSYQLMDERGKLPSVNIGLAIYDDRGDPEPTPPEPPAERVTNLTNTKWLFRDYPIPVTPNGVNMEDDSQIPPGLNIFGEGYHINFSYENSNQEYSDLVFRKSQNWAVLNYSRQNEYEKWIHDVAYDFKSFNWDSIDKKTITITGGSHILNKKLIDWLYENAVLLEQGDLPELPKPSNLANTIWVLNDVISKNDMNQTFDIYFDLPNQEETPLHHGEYEKLSIYPSSLVESDAISYGYYNEELEDYTFEVVPYTPASSYEPFRTIRILNRGSEAMLTNQDLIDWLWENASRIN